MYECKRNLMRTGKVGKKIHTQLITIITQQRYSMCFLRRKHIATRTRRGMDKYPLYCTTVCDGGHTQIPPYNIITARQWSRNSE